MGKRANGEGSKPYKRKDGRWCARYTAHTPDGPKRRSVYGKTRAEASTKLFAAIADRDGRVAFDPSTMPLSEYLARWLADSVRGSVSELTYLSHEQQCRVHIVPALGGVPLSKLTPGHLQAFYSAKLRGGTGTGALRNVHKTLHKALSQAERWGMAEHNAAARVSPPRHASQEMSPLSWPEIEAFLQAVEGDRLEALFHLAVRTGMREGELLALRWADVDLASGWLAVRRSVTVVSGTVRWSETKTRRGRSIKLAPKMLTRLQLHRARQLEERMKVKTSLGWRDPALVFPGPTGDVLRKESLVSRFERRLRDAGVRRIRFHDLRHTAATLMLAQGERPAVVQRMLGHASISQTIDTYSHVTPDLHEDAANRLDALLS